MSAPQDTLRRRWGLRRLREASLAVKLTVLGTLVTSLVIGAAFWALSIQTRRAVRGVLAEELDRQQQTLARLQQENLNQLVWNSGLITQSPPLLSALSTFRAESNFGAGGNADLVRTVERELARLLDAVDRDLLVVTNEQGRVFAAAFHRSGAAPAWPRRGTDLSTLPAVRRVLAPSAPADSGMPGVIRDGDAAFHVAVHPLVVDGFTIGALILGERLDDGLVASARAVFRGEVVVTAGSVVLTGTSHDSSLGTRLQALANRDEQAPLAQLDGVDHVVAALPLGDTQQGDRVTLWLMRPIDPAVRALTVPLRRNFILYGLVAVLLSAIGAAVAVRSTLRPFDAFVRYLRSGSPANRAAPRFAAAGQPAEIQTLTESFDALMDSINQQQRELTQRTTELTAANAVLTDEIAERKRMELQLGEREQQLRQSQKLEAVGTLAGGIAHDFNNLLTAMSGFAQLALLNTDPGSSVASDLRQVVEAADRASHLTRQLLAFSRKQVLSPTVLDIGDVVQHIEPMLTRLLGAHITIRVELDQDVSSVVVDRGQLEQVIMNLAINARDAMPHGGTLTLSVRERDTAQGRTVLLSVRDTGTGIPEEIRSRVFEPFFTTKEPGKGTGLGLSTVYGIVTQSGGQIEVDSTVNVGTTFRVMFPAATDAAVAASIGAPQEPLPRGTETILLVEDEPVVRSMARRTLEECGYTVLPAGDPLEALQMATTARVDVLLTDIRMPNLSGLELVDRFLVEHPAPIVIYMSGYADDAAILDTRRNRAAFLRKPFTPAVLAREVRDAIDAALRVPVLPFA